MPVIYYYILGYIILFYIVNVNNRNLCAFMQSYVSICINSILHCVSRICTTSQINIISIDIYDGMCIYVCIRVWQKNAICFFSRKLENIVEHVLTKILSEVQLVISILRGFTSNLKFFHLNNTHYRYFLHYFLSQAVTKLFIDKIND